VPKAVIFVAAIKLPVESIEAITFAPYLNCNLPPDSVIVKLAVEKELPATAFAAKEPFASLTTIVLAPLAVAAVVLALAKVPVVILEALIAVMAAPLPETVVKVPVVAVTVPLTTKLPVVPDIPSKKLTPSQ
jgi:hypothetical protein